MDELTKLIPDLPEWVAIPLVIAVVLLGLSPKIRQVIQDLSSTYRAYEIERRRLELLKLRLEIEAIVKEHSLNIDLASFRPEEKPEAPPPRPYGVSSGVPVWQMIMVGALGAISPTLIRIPNSYVLGSDLGMSVFFFVGLALFAVIGAVVVYVMRPANLYIAFLLGFAMPALIQLSLGAVSDAPPLPQHM